MFNYNTINLVEKGWEQQCKLVSSFMLDFIDAHYYMKVFQQDLPKGLSAMFK